jgi:nucleolar complex protein 2
LLLAPTRSQEKEHKTPFSHSNSPKRQTFLIMAKQTKRARKFVQSGGVKKRLEKGTITNKGKLKSNRQNKNKKDGDDETNDKQRRAAKDKTLSLSEEKLEKRRQDDFTSRENLADLDMDSFFATFSDKKELSDENEDVELEENSSDEDEDSDKEDESVDNNDDDSSADDDDDKPETKKSKNAKSTKSKPTKKAKKKDSDDDDSSNSSDSEDEDIEKAERRMKQEMGKLASSDPEFHEFLQENEQGLLEYGDDNDEDPEEEEEDDDDDDEKDDDDVDRKQKIKDRRSDKKKELEDETGRNLIILTADVLEKLEENAFELHTVKGLKKIVTAYKSACHMADGSHDDSDDAKKSSKGRKKYHIESSGIFDRLMVTCLNSVHEEIYYHLLGKGAEKSATGTTPLQENKKKSNKKDKKKNKKGTKKDDDDDEDEEHEEGERQPIDMSDDNKPLNPKLLEKAPRWKDMEPILFTFVKSTLHVLSEAKEPDLVTYILKALSKYLPYMTPFPRLGESMLKVMISLWSAPIDASEDYQVVRLHSFLRIRQLALTQPFPLIEECLKKAYLAYAQRAKFANASSVTSTLPTLTFMGNCVVELFSLDYHSSYQHAFVYIRQLALLLRTAMQKKTPESFSAVYCWQYLHCLKLWVAVLTEACQARDDNDPAAAASVTEEQLLASLLFPLSQIIIGTVRLIPSTRYLPLRLHCVRLLQQLAAATEVFLPTTAILLEVFDLRELSLQAQKVKKNNVQPLVLTFRLKKENPLRTMEEMEMCVSEVFLLLNREVEIYQYSAGFPEFAVRICQRLRKVRVYENNKVVQRRVMFHRSAGFFVCANLFISTHRSLHFVAPSSF